MIIDTHAHIAPAILPEAMRAERRLFPSATRMEFRERLATARVDRPPVGGGGPR